ncbi:transcription antitermination factor NusB [Mycoplasmatota bacterium]|nr:transcription antitermination factor NusB [Mycoplasmatota bacterium]
MNRKKEREIIVLSLYSMELSDNDINETVHYILEQNKIKQEATDYIYDSINGVLENKEKIDEIIANNLENYKIERLSYIDLSIIRFATYELLYIEDIHHAVIINEAVEITKKYSDLGDHKASAFNNRVMDNIRLSIK